MDSRIVFDTNVLISALGWNAKPEDCIEEVFQGSAEGYISKDMREELQEVMEYPRFEFAEEEKKSFLELILASFRVVEPSISLEVLKEDPDDNMVLECAVETESDYIVSGDSHLKDIGTYEDIEIITPAELLEKI